MGTGKLLASGTLLLGVAGGLVFWLTRQPPTQPSDLPPPIAPSDPRRRPQDETRTEPTGPKEIGSPDDPREVGLVAFTYVADGRKISVSQEEFESIKKRLEVYNDLDFAEQQGDNDVYEYVFGSYEVRDAGIRISEPEVQAEYVRLFQSEEYEEELKSLLDLYQMRRADLDEVIRGKLGARKLRSIVRESGVSSDQDTFEELKAYDREYRLVYVAFPAAPHLAEFAVLPAAEADQQAFKKCKEEAAKVKAEILALNEELCKPAIEGIQREEQAAAEKQISERPGIDAAATEAIREEHRRAAEMRVLQHTRAANGRAFDQYVANKGLKLGDTGWYHLPSPLKPTLPENATFFERYSLPSRLLMEQFGGVYEDTDNLVCYLAKKVDERAPTAALPAAEILRGRRRFSNRLGFKREICLRFLHLMKKYKCAPTEGKTAIPTALPGSPAPTPPAGVSPADPALRKGGRPPGIPDPSGIDDPGPKAPVESGDQTTPGERPIKPGEKPQKPGESQEKREER